MAVSAVSSHAVPAITALRPSTSPDPAIFRMRTLPSFEVVESFTLPEHSTNIPRGIWPSMNSSAPPGKALIWPMLLKCFSTSGEKLQKAQFFLSLQLRQFSPISKPYGALIALSWRKRPPHKDASDPPTVSEPQAEKELCFLQ